MTPCMSLYLFFSLSEEEPLQQMPIYLFSFVFLIIQSSQYSMLNNTTGYQDGSQKAGSSSIPSLLKLSKFEHAKNFSNNPNGKKDFQKLLKIVSGVDPMGRRPSPKLANKLITAVQLYEVAKNKSRERTREQSRNNSRDKVEQTRPRNSQFLFHLSSAYHYKLPQGKSLSVLKQNKSLDSHPMKFVKRTSTLGNSRKSSVNNNPEGTSMVDTLQEGGTIHPQQTEEGIEDQEFTGNDPSLKSKIKIVEKQHPDDEENEIKGNEHELDNKLQQTDKELAMAKQAEIMKKKEIFKQRKQKSTRLRDLGYDRSRFLCKFEGISIKHYDKTVLGDSTIQKVVIRDQLFILADKLFYFKVTVSDEMLHSTLDNFAEKETLMKVNQLIEELLCFLDRLCQLLLYELRNDLKALEIGNSPVAEAKEAADYRPLSEKKNYLLNTSLLIKTYDYFRQAIDTFFLMCKFRPRILILDYQPAVEVVEICDKARLTISVLANTYKAEHERVRNKRYSEPIQNVNSQKKSSNAQPEELQEGSDQQKENDLSKVKSIDELVGDLYKIKFNMGPKGRTRIPDQGTKIDLRKEMSINQLNFVEIDSRKKPSRNFYIEEEKMRVKHEKEIDRNIELLDKFSQKVEGTLEVLNNIKTQKQFLSKIPEIDSTVKEINDLDWQLMGSAFVRKQIKKQIAK